MLAMIILVLGIFSRIVLHIPNFTPVIALVFFGGVYLKRKYAVLVPLVLMMATDLYLGIHSVIVFTWASMILISFIGLSVRKQKRPVSILGGSLGAAVVFFVITNLGVWFMGWYTYTWDGLLRCYVAAIPFFRSTLISTLAYSMAFFGIYELIASRVKNSRLAHVLLLN